MEQRRILEDWLGFLLGQAHERIYSLCEKCLEHLKIHPRHLRILIITNENDGLNQQQISEIVSVHRNVMVSLTDQLEAKGLLKRVAHPENRRAYVLQITARGRKVLKEAVQLCRKVESEMLSTFSKQEQEQLFTMLRRLSPE
jgi:DNA-binding MarR family transcriptional regulator